MRHKRTSWKEIFERDRGFFYISRAIQAYTRYYRIQTKRKSFEGGFRDSKDTEKSPKAKKKHDNRTNEILNKNDEYHSRPTRTYIITRQQPLQPDHAENKRVGIDERVLDDPWEGKCREKFRGVKPS